MSDCFLVGSPRCATPHVRDRDRCSYRVAWRINPHMQIGAADPDRAACEHTRFVRTLRAHGADVRELPFVHGLYDSVFVKDAAIVVDAGGARRALPATSATPERAREFRARIDQLAGLGIATHAPLAAPLEGGDVALVAHRRLALVGYGQRTNPAALDGLVAFLGDGWRAIPLRLVTSALYHLDTALAVTADDTLVFCPEAFDRASVDALRRLAFARALAVDPADAHRFALNVVELADGAIVTGSPSAGMWRALGRDVVVAPLPQFQLAGGSAACLVARVTPVDHAAVFARTAATRRTLSPAA